MDGWMDGPIRKKQQRGGGGEVEAVRHVRAHDAKI